MESFNTAWPSELLMTPVRKPSMKTLSTWLTFVILGGPFSGHISKEPLLPLSVSLGT